MKAVRFHQYGSPEVLVVDEIPVPKPAPGEVLLKVAAVGVNYADVMRRRNDPYPETTPLPFVLGLRLLEQLRYLARGLRLLLWEPQCLQHRGLAATLNM